MNTKDNPKSTLINLISNKISHIVMFTLLIIWAILQLYPIIWMLLSSLKTEPDFMINPFGLPSKLTFENYLGAWSGLYGVIGVAEYMKNSLIVVIPSIIILTFVSTIAAYAIAKFDFFGRKVLLSFFIALLAIPVHSVIISVYRLMVNFHLLNSYLGLILLYIAFNIPFSVIILQAYFRSFKQELIDASKIDGCSDFSSFFRIVFPISRGAIASVTIVNFIVIWNEFLFAFVINPSLKTLTVGILGYKTEYLVHWTLMFAGLTITAIPAILFYFVFQRNIIKGMTLGAVKE